MAVNVADVQDQTLSIENIHPKLRPIKSHPYLNTYSTPPLPKPFHFHQLSDQTGQSSYHQNNNNFSSQHKHQLSTISLPSQLPIKNNGHESNFKPILNQSNCLNKNIEQYEMSFSYSDLEKRKELNQQIYINHPIINRSNELLDSATNSNATNFNLNGHSSSEERTYQNCQVNSHFNHIENFQKENHKTSPNQSENPNIIQATYHGLPIKFVKALKKLFDVFDTNKCGFIRILDIENRIKDEEFDEELDRPQDLIDSLRKVSSPMTGLINFSNFCAAINICLLKNQLAKSRQQQDFKPVIPIKPKSDRNDSYLKAQNLDKNALSPNANHNLNEYPTANGHSNGHILNYRKSAYHHQKYSKQSSLNSNSPLENSSFTSTSSSNSSTKQEKLNKDFNKLSMRSNQNSQTMNNKQLKYRPSSVPVEFDDEEADYYKRNVHSNLMSKKLSDNKAKSMGSLKEQIYANKLRLCSSESRLQQNQVISSQAIMQKLFEWRNNLLERKLRLMNGNMNDQINNQFNQLQPPQFNGQSMVQSNSQLNHLYSIVNKKKTTHRKIDEARRHTVTSLHSLNSSKKLFNMQKEKDLLQQGLVIIEKAKKFYLRQIDIVQNQIDHLRSQDGNNFFINQLNNDYNIKQHLDKLNTLEQINRNFAFLVENQFTQTNLRFSNVQPEIEIQKQNLIIFKLKEQIQMLSDELRKANAILNLERSNSFFKTNLI